jgi:predicted metal-dependent HD superfamily phosphohydrolase
MITPERLAGMREDWTSALAREGVSSRSATGPFERLAASYSAPERVYHNLEHISEMLEVVARLAVAIDDPVAVRLAVWFHDAVYDTRRSDNEEKSAALASDVLGTLSVSRRTTEHVAAMIRATAHLSSPEPPPDPDTTALLDADLAILGAAPERYSRYARDIRLE